MPANLDTAFVETSEGFDFDWPESLAVERVHFGIAEISAVFLFAGFVVLAQRTISILPDWIFRSIYDRLRMLYR